MQKKIGKALVVGAGISGIRSALDLAECGYGVTLIDRKPHIGGILSQLDNQFPSNHCGMCRMLPVVERDNASQFCLRKGLFHENIDIRPATQLTAVEGEPGHMKVRLRKAPTWVDPHKCVGCGQCVDVCPVDVPDDFNAGLSMRKAIYLPVPHTIPNAYVIDSAACNHCGECEKICPTQAIDLAQDQRKQFRILVVDDELVMRDSLKEWLDDEGFSVDMADSGAQALERLKQKDYHLMLTDIKMPGMDGVELLKRTKENWPQICVIMMTAYATVETAVDAMKIGALDYLMKPFDPAKMIPMVVQIYEEMIASQDQEFEVGIIVMACGCDYYDPSQGKNPYGYGVNPHVVTHLEFERLLSGTGPMAGRLVRPADQKPITKIAFLQCVGSRDVQASADYCSSICCMIAVKEALLAKEKGGANLDTAIFYMDMRTFGLSHQRYCDQARDLHKVRFLHSRVHTLTTDPVSGDPLLRSVSMDGSVEDETFDLVVLAAGQRPADGMEQLTELSGLTLNPWGFIQNTPLSLVHTDNQGILTSGSCAGLKEISESVILASAAAAEAGRELHATGGSLGMEAVAEPALRDLSAEIPRVMVVVCTCGDALNRLVSPEHIKEKLSRDPCVAEVVFKDRFCTADGWQALSDLALEVQPNRILIGVCHPYAFVPRLKSLAADLGLAPRFIEAVELRIHGRQSDQPPDSHTPIASLAMALTRLKHANPLPAAKQPVIQRALVVGGGIAGLQAALSIADQGYPVTLVEKQAHLGGNLRWLKQTIEGWGLEDLLADKIAEVEKHPKIEVLLQTTVKGAFGQVGRFFTTLETEQQTPQTLEHGVVVLATGGHEASTQSFGYGTHDSIVTQKELETGLAEAHIDPQKLSAVAMILCVDSRQEPRNYCSRVCCPTALKQALRIKAANPDAMVYVLYRDMMTYGFTETYFTQARQAGVIFIHYDLQQIPVVQTAEADRICISCPDPILGASLEINVDLLVLATGVVPGLSVDLAASFDADIDADGFFKPADFKWRPVDAMAQGVFACGCTHSPRNVAESMATAQAAAQRALGILMRRSIVADHVVAHVRHSLCSLCERCIAACPYAARTLSPEKDKVLVNPLMCQGCGACASTCPNSAAVVDGYSDGQMLETIDAVLNG